MPSPLRRVLVTAVLTLSALASLAVPAGAQTNGLFQQTAAKSANADASFLTAGMVQQAPPPSGGSRGRAEGFGFGVKGGFLFPSFDTATASNLKGKTGTAIGIFFGGNRGGRVGVMGEILYANKNVEAGTVETKLYYLEIPILLRINVGSSSRNGVSVYGLVGNVYDINLKAKQGNFDVKNNFESLDIGLIVGAGVEITRFILEGRYNWGFRNISSNNIIGGDIKTKTFALLLGFRIN